MVPIGRAGVIGFGHGDAVVFIVMAVDAEQLPVAAVGRIVVVIMVLVVHCQFAQAFA